MSMQWNGKMGHLCMLKIGHLIRICVVGFFLSATTNHKYVAFSSIDAVFSPEPSSISTIRSFLDAQHPIKLEYIFKQYMNV